MVCTKSIINYQVYLNKCRGLGLREFQTKIIHVLLTYETIVNSRQLVSQPAI